MRCDVAIIGAGPAGLSAARALVRAGVRDVLVIERASEPGGLPRFCEHVGWGMLDCGRLLTGPAYARALAARAAGAEILLDATVTAIEPGGRLRVETGQGPATVDASAVLLATGIRETPRGPRLISGTRPWGVTTTGAFQAMIQAGQPPFRRPVVAGSELVAFSALLTARGAGLRPVAMIEPAPRITARRPADLIARALWGVPVLTGTSLIAIHGAERVEAVTLEHAGRERRLVCDGVIFSGHFIPEAFLARSSGLVLDPGTGGPAIDSAFRCSDPAVFAAGNVLRPVEHSGFVAREGAAAAAAILRALRGERPRAAIPVTAGGALRFVVPQRVLPGAAVTLQARAAEPCRGHLRLLADGAVLAERALHALPERRLSLRVPAQRLAGVARLSLVLE